MESATDLFLRANAAWDEGQSKIAFALFGQAAKKGDVSAYNSIGYFYDHGIGVRKDPIAALRWYKRAASKGDVCAFSNLGVSYKDKKNFRWAKYWFEKALAGGDEDAALELGKLFLGKMDSHSASCAISYLQIAARSVYIDRQGRTEAKKLLRIAESRASVHLAA